ncbi:MAG: sugar transferase [Ahrensia sp.]|nr:sugar transferase [Ahrensia sp.]
MKRIFDFVTSLFGIIAFSPLMLIIMVIIWAQRDGQIIFAQVRVGKDQVPFVCYKFRTMVVGTPQLATHEVGVNNITVFGAKLRRYKLDELPQLYNVLAGDMSLVGPRPCLPTQHDLIAARAVRNVFLLRPGITGLAQINGIDMRDPEKLAKIDALYFSDNNILNDIWIIFKTLIKRN